MPRRPPIRLSAPTRVRRSHAERSAETRARILDGVLSSINDVGFGKTTAAEITRRAGVTWGAVQHHFGDKDGILLALVERSFDEFEARLEGMPTRGTSLSERVRLFLDRAWGHFSSPEYRSTFEILLNHLGRGDGAAPSSWQGRMFRAWDRIWLRLFHDAPIPRRRHRVLEHYVIAALSGLASTLMLEGPGARLRDEELGLLADTLVRELTRGG